MKKIIIATITALATVSLYPHLEAKVISLKSSYDMPIKCGICGNWHLPGVPCPKR